MAANLPEFAREIFDDRTFVTLCTINADGSPQSSVVWAERDGDDLLISTVRGRRKERNMTADPRVSLCAYPQDDPYTYVEVRGTATMVDEGGRELIQRLSHRYDGAPFRVEPPEVQRVVVRVTPTRVVSRVSPQSRHYKS